MLERLQKIIARAGIASRRHAEELIVSGQVTVNGVVVNELGAKADPEHDKIEAAGRVAEQPLSASYYILNKPPHVVSTMSDPEGRATLRHVLRGLSGSVFPVGRLDYNAAGLILLTSDGKLADSIFKNSSNLVKVYWMKVDGRPSKEALAKITHKAQARVRLLPTPEASMGAGHAINPWYEAELRAARRDLLRQEFFAAGHPVEKIRRVKFGPLELGDLPEGQYRQLTPSEVAALRRAVETAEAQPAQPQTSPLPVGVRAFERKKWRPRTDDAAGPSQPVQQFDNARPADRSSGRPPGPKKPWQPRFDRGPKPPFQPGGGSGDRGGRPRFSEDRFAAGGKGAPNSGGPPRGDRPFSSGGERPGSGSRGPRFAPGSKTGPRPRGGSPRFGQDKFAPPAKGGSYRGGSGEERRFPPSSGSGGGKSFRPGAGRSFPPGDRGPQKGGFAGRSFPPRGDRGETAGGKPFRPRDDRGGAPSGRPFPPRSDRGVSAGGRPFPPRGERSGPNGGSRGAGPRTGAPHFGGDRPASSGKGAPTRGGAGGGRFFPPRGERTGPSSGGRSTGSGPSDQRGGYRGKGSGKFAGPPRTGGPSGTGAGKFGSKRPGSRQPGKPGARPSRPRSGPSKFPPRRP